MFVRVLVGTQIIPGIDAIRRFSTVRLGMTLLKHTHISISLLLRVQYIFRQCLPPFLVQVRSPTAVT